MVIYWKWGTVFGLKGGPTVCGRSPCVRVNETSIPKLKLDSAICSSGLQRRRSVTHVGNIFRRVLHIWAYARRHLGHGRAL